MQRGAARSSKFNDPSSAIAARRKTVNRLEGFDRLPDVSAILAGESAVPILANGNGLMARDRAAHDWYRFVLSFPPHLVRHYIQDFDLQPGDRLMDPFCGTGTTLVEGKMHGLETIGLEPNPMARFASSVKTAWNCDVAELQGHSRSIAANTRSRLSKRRGRRRGLPAEQARMLLEGSISPLPLHKTLVLLEEIRTAEDRRFIGYELLALAKGLTGPIGNLHFGPEVGVGSRKDDADVVSVWCNGMEDVVRDLLVLTQIGGGTATVLDHDARSLDEVIEPNSISAVITSPPYPSEKDYTRATRLESVILGFIRNRSELRDVKQELIRSNTKNVYKGDSDCKWIAGVPEVEALVSMVESSRVELNKTSGFEKLYSRVAELYFGGMARHLANLRPCLKKGAKLAYVVGDQASYFRVLIKTGELLGEIARSLGYTVVRRDLFRLRHSTSTGHKLREEVLVLRWDGNAVQLRE